MRWQYLHAMPKTLAELVAFLENWFEKQAKQNQATQPPQSLLERAKAASLSAPQIQIKTQSPAQIAPPQAIEAEQDRRWLLNDEERLFLDQLAAATGFIQAYDPVLREAIARLGASQPDSPFDFTSDLDELDDLAS